MHLPSPLLTGFLVSLLLFQVVWIFAYVNRRNDYADVLWGTGFALVAWAGLAADSAPGPRAWIVVGLVNIWGLRLSWHVGARNLSRPEEDARYAKWRKEWGSTWLWRSYLQVFVLQALILYVISLSVLWIEASPEMPLGSFGIAGITLWALGFFFEAVGDAQLKKFTREKSNKGKFIEQGLWAWSRHPNYFGEVVQWWGIFLLACEVPGGWKTAVAPLAISFLILKVSGVPMLEEQMRSRPGFADYARRVPKFFPLPPGNRS